MALNAKYRVSLFFVFFLGLVSCSKDKDVIYQPLPVDAQNVGAMDSQRRMQWAKNITELELGGELVIDLLRQQDFEKNPMVVRVQSWCRSETIKGDLYNDIHFKNQFSIPVINALAPEALLSVSSQPLECSFTMTLSDSISSQAIYKFENITIRNSSTFNNLEILPTDTNALYYEKIKQDVLASGDHYHLQCTDFQKILTVQGELNWATLLTSSPLDIHSLTRSQQNCRLLIKSSQDVFLSKPFTLVFQPQELLIRAEYKSLPPINMELTTRQVLTLKMMNPNNYDVKLKINQLHSSFFSFAPIYTGDAAIGYAGNKRDFPLSWSLQPTPFVVSQTNEEWVLQIPAKQEITVDVFVNIKLHCDVERKPRPNIINTVPGLPYFVGIHYGFNFQTQFLTHLHDEEWTPNNLLQGALASQTNDGALVFWDVYYEQAKARFKPFFFNPLNTNSEFIHAIDAQRTYDRCIPL